MSTSTHTFNVVYSPEVAIEAARKFRDDRFKRYAVLMVASCIINTLGLIVALGLGARLRDVASLVVSFVVIVGPVWLLYQQFVWPERYVRRLLRLLPSPGRISISGESISFATVGQDAVLPWSGIKRVLETQSAFVIVWSPFVFLFLPASDLPVEVRDTLRAKVTKLT